jgi:hypothetical protein
MGLAKRLILPIELYLAPVSSHDALPLGLPCHTCKPFSSPFVKHLNHYQPPSNIVVIDKEFSCSAGKSNQWIFLPIDYNSGLFYCLLE